MHPHAGRTDYNKLIAVIGRGHQEQQVRAGSVRALDPGGCGVGVITLGLQPVGRSVHTGSGRTSAGKMYGGAVARVDTHPSEHGDQHRDPAYISIGEV